MSSFVALNKIADMQPSNVIPPKIDNIADLYSTESKNRDLIVKFAHDNPSIDHYYTFKIKKDEGLSASLSIFTNNIMTDRICIAGSSALWRLSFILNGLPQWKPSDHDVFLLNSTENGRYNVGGYGLDMVHSTDTNPIDLISNFDLPCCRVAFDFNFTFYVSIQALAAIISKQMYLPEYFKSKCAFKNMWMTNSTIKEDLPVVKRLVDFKYDYIYNRLQERIIKYRSRGFSPNYYKTSYVLPWIKNRFRYSEFTEQNDPYVLDNTMGPNENIRALKLKSVTNQNLAKSLMDITGRSKANVIDSINILLHEYDIITMQDLFLVNEGTQISSMLKAIKSVPIRNALHIIWRKGHETLQKKVI